jgi:hypothetical protein
MRSPTRAACCTVTNVSRQSYCPLSESWDGGYAQLPGSPKSFECFLDDFQLQSLYGLRLHRIQVDIPPSYGKNVTSMRWALMSRHRDPK